MTAGKKADDQRFAGIRKSVEDRAEEDGWQHRYHVTVINTETNERETIEVPARDERHAQTNAMFFVRMKLRGALVDFEIEEV